MHTGDARARSGRRRRLPGSGSGDEACPVGLRVHPRVDQRRAVRMQRLPQGRRAARRPVLPGRSPPAADPANRRGSRGTAAGATPFCGTGGDTRQSGRYAAPTAAQAPSGHPSAGGQRSRLGVVAAPGTWPSGCVNRWWTPRWPLAVMRRADQAEIFRVRAAALGDRQQVVELQQMGGGTAPVGDRIAIAAASLIALPHQAPDGGGNGAPGSSGPGTTAGTRRGRRGPGSRTGPAAGR